MCKCKCRACAQAPGGGGWCGGPGALPPPAWALLSQGGWQELGGGFAAPSITSNRGPCLSVSSLCFSGSGGDAESLFHFPSRDPAQFGAVSYQLMGKLSKDVDQPCRGVTSPEDAPGMQGELGTSCPTAMPRAWLPGGHGDTAVTAAPVLTAPQHAPNTV